MNHNQGDKTAPPGVDPDRLEDELAQAVERSYGRRLSTANNLTEEERRRIREKQGDPSNGRALDDQALGKGRP